jgi:hypothetical protein
VKDVFGSATGRKQEETTSRELPVKQWFIARIATQGGAKPHIKYTNGDHLPFMFKTGLYCIGGDGKQVKENMYGLYTFFNAFLRPNYKDQGGPQSQDDYDALNGRLVGFMNALLSPGIEDKEARWANTQRQLGEYAGKLAEDSDSERRCDAGTFTLDGGIVDNAAYMATVFVFLLIDSPRHVIVNQRVDKGKDGDRNDLVVGSYKDAIDGNAKGLTMFTSRDGEAYEFYGATSEEDVSGF